MNVAEAIVEIMKREGIEYLIAYPHNFLIDPAAASDMRPVIVRQERTGVHMADAISRVTSGRRLGAFSMQWGPGSENAFGGVAQAYANSVPVLVVPMGYARRLAHVEPNFNSTISMRTISKSVEPILSPTDVVPVMRRAFSRLRNGRGSPVLVELPNDLWSTEMPGPIDYKPVVSARFGPDRDDVHKALSVMLKAKRLVIYAGQGVHYARAWPQLRALAERLAAPVCTSLQGKSAFPEDHPLALGAGGMALPKPVRHFLDHADVIFGIGCSFSETMFGAAMPPGARYIHATLDPNHVNKDVPAEVALVGDAALTLESLLEQLDGDKVPPRDMSVTAREISAVREPWLQEWMPKLTSAETPLNPYRVLWDLQKTVDVANTIITHDAGSPRDQLSPFWVCKEPLTYIGWGKSTQLGYGLGLAMGAKLAFPDKLCINVWGDAAIGFTGMDFETAVREQIPILSILLNNFSMAMEIGILPLSTEKFRTTDISGDYAAMARAFGGYGERVTSPDEIIPAIRRGIAKTQEGIPALLEFITSKETKASRFS